MEKALKRYSPFFVLPTLLAFLIGFVIPFAEGLYLSFCQFTTVGNAKWVGFSNYKNIFSDASFIHSFKFTVAFAVVSIILINVIAFGLALLLTRNLRGTNVFRTVFFMPNLIGGIVLQSRSLNVHRFQKVNDLAGLFLRFYTKRLENL